MEEGAVQVTVAEASPGTARTLVGGPGARGGEGVGEGAGGVGVAVGAGVGALWVGEGAAEALGPALGGAAQAAAVPRVSRRRPVPVNAASAERAAAPAP
jgi:hypothetical protein